MTQILVILFFALLALSVPVAHAMLGGTVVALLLEGKPLAVIAQRLYAPTQSFPMLAVPYFILAGSLMMHGKFGEYLVNIARLLVGRFKGGLGQVSVIGSVMFGGVSGSAVADASAMGNALIPVQVKDGYPAPFAAAINSASSTIAVLIPPSIPLILYGLVANVSIIDLFVAGILPRLVLGAGIMLAVWLVARAKGLPAAPLPGGFAAFRSQILFALPALLMPLFVIGTLRFGVATPTEVSVLAVAYALFIGAFFYRDLSARMIWDALVETGMMTGAVMLIIMASGTIQWVLTAAVLLLGPLFVTIGKSIGLDPVQLGLMMVINLSIGLYTPPVGTTLFISSAIARTGIGETTRALLPFYLVAVVVLLAFSFIPALTIY